MVYARPKWKLHLKCKESILGLFLSLGAHALDTIAVAVDESLVMAAEADETVAFVKSFALGLNATWHDASCADVSIETVLAASRVNGCVTCASTDGALWTLLGFFCYDKFLFVLGDFLIPAVVGDKEFLFCIELETKILISIEVYVDSGCLSLHGVAYG